MWVSKSHLALVAAAAMVVSALAGTSAASAAVMRSPCQLERLATPWDTPYARVAAGDPSGRWLTGPASHDDATRAVVWHDGVPAELNLPYDYANPGRINRRGVVAGTASLDGAFFGFVSDHGSLTKLPLPPGMESLTITGISRRGDVSGWAMTADGSTASAYVWPADDPRHPVRLRTSPGFSTTEGMSPDGHVAVKKSNDDDGGFRSFVFSAKGHRIELEAPTAGYDAGAGGIANGWVAGNEEVSPPGEGRAHTVRWDLATGEANTVPVEFYGPPAVNSNGLLGGVRLTDDGIEPILYGDHLVKLPNLTPGGSAEITVVSRAGDAAGSADTDSGESTVAVRWQCG